MTTNTTMSHINLFQKEQEAAFHSLQTIESDSWQRLVQGSLSAKSDFRLPVIGTVNGAHASMRTVVLRKAWPLEKQVAFYTDVRSDKMEDIAINNSISLLFYSRTHRLQFRLQGQATIHSDDKIAETAWSHTTLSSRKSYLSKSKPGSISPHGASGLPDIMINRDPKEEETEPGRKNFAVVITKVKTIEWLWLNNQGHRRAVFEYENTDYKAHWLIP